MVLCAICWVIEELPVIREDCIHRVPFKGEGCMDLCRKRVVKLGGSILNSQENFAGIPQLLSLYENPVVVVSALSGVTNKLDTFAENLKSGKFIDSIENFISRLRKQHLKFSENAIQEPFGKPALQALLDTEFTVLRDLLQGLALLGEIPDSVRARILSVGERLSAFALSHVLCRAGSHACVVDPEEMGLITDGCFLNATVDIARSKRRVNRALGDSFIAVVPGFYGLSAGGRITLLGRGGSDYSAAAIAACIGAPSLDIFKDVAGYLSADPAFVTDVRAIPRLSYREAAELSYFGARILHPRTMEPLCAEAIPIRLFPFPVGDSPEPATVIGRRSSVDDVVVKSVTFSDDFSVVEVRGDGVGLVPGLLARVSDAVGRAGINIKSVITAQTAINLLLERGDAKPAAAEVNKLAIHAVEAVQIQENVGVVAVVGEGIRTRPGIAARMFTALATAGINVRMIAFGASPVAAYFVVSREDRVHSVAAIHQAFFSRAVTI